MFLDRALTAAAPRNGRTPLHRLTPVVWVAVLAALAAPEPAAAIPDSESARPTGTEIVAAPDGVYPAVAAMDDRVLVAWATRTAPRRVVARIFDGVGTPLAGPLDLGAYADHDGIGGRVAAATAGPDRFVVAWTGPRADEGVVGVYARRVLRSGHLEPAALVSGTGPRPRFEPDVAGHASGRYAISWTTDRSPVSYFDVFARRFEADGSPDGSPFLVNEDVDNSQRAGRLALLGDGTLLAVWESLEGEARLSDIFIRSFGPGGVPLGGESVVNSDPDLAIAGQTEPAIAVLADGGFVVVWSGYYARMYSAAGAARTDDLVLGSGDVFAPPAVAGDPAGGFLVLWERDCGVGCGRDILGRSVRADGSPAGGAFLVPAHNDGPQSRPALALVPLPAGLFAAWEHDPAATGSPEIVVGRLALPCVTDDRSACLHGGRFRASALKLDRHFPRIPAVPVERGGDWATFWWFRPANVEVAVKVLDGRVLNGHFWVFYASLTNLDFALWVEDLVTGRVARYENPLGTMASRGDTTALPAPLEGPPAALVPAALRPTVAVASDTAPASGPCQPTATRACFHGGRFAAEIRWQDFFGNQGMGGWGNLTADTTYSWFFREGNPEVLVKVLDGGAFNDRIWVFYGALTNVAFDLVVTDTETGQVNTYRNPLGHFASVGDAAAFPR